MILKWSKLKAGNEGYRPGNFVFSRNPNVHFMASLKDSVELMNHWYYTMYLQKTAKYLGYILIYCPNSKRCVKIERNYV